MVRTYTSEYNNPLQPTAIQATSPNIDVLKLTFHHMDFDFDTEHMCAPTSSPNNGNIR